MSSLIVAQDLGIVMLEVVVENLYVPWGDVLDKTIMKKTIIMFRMLDDEWTSLLPNRPDYRPYRGSNYENETFHGGKSVVFSVPEIIFEEKVNGIDIQFYVCKEASKYFEMESRQNFGFALVRVDDLLNSIIKDRRERKELEDYMTKSLERQLISRSLRGVYTLVDEDLQETDATIELYVRISYLGKCVTTEIHSPESIRKAFYAREETDTHYPYQFRELTSEELYTGCWGSATILSPNIHDHLVCHCQKYGITGRRAKDHAEDQAGKLRLGSGKGKGRIKGKGMEGIKGKEGAKGSKGINGKEGAKGREGTKGKEGTDGRDGIKGKEGAEGREGKKGKDGAEGRGGTKGKEGAEGREGDHEDDEQSRIKKLLALLRASRRGKGSVTVGLTEKPKKVCPSPPSSFLSTTPCPLTCRCLQSSGYCPVPRQPPFTFYRAHYRAFCPITCSNNTGILNCI